MSLHIQRCVAAKAYVEQKAKVKAVESGERLDFKKMEFRPGGKIMLGEIKQAMREDNYAKKVITDYSNKLANKVFPYFEGKYSDFLVDYLLFPLEAQISFPPIKDYLRCSDDTTCGKLVAIKAYKVFCSVADTLFTTR